MLNLEPITLYHIIDDDTGAFERTVYQGSVYKSIRQTSEDGGFSGSDAFKIRIPGVENINIAKNDYIFLGEGPDKLNSLECRKVVFIADNRRGSLPHFRIEAV